MLCLRNQDLRISQRGTLIASHTSRQGLVSHKGLYTCIVLTWFGRVFEDEMLVSFYSICLSAEVIAQQMALSEVEARQSCGLVFLLNNNCEMELQPKAKNPSERH